MVIDESYFIYISAFIVLIYLVMMFIGYKKGFLFEVVNLLYTALALALAWFASPVLAKSFPIITISEVSDELKILLKYANLDINYIVNTIAYFLIVFLVLKVLYIFISLLVKSFNKIPVIGKFNQILGALFGVLNATLIVLSLSMLLSLPIIKNGNEIKEKTILKYVNNYSDMALKYLTEKITINSSDINSDFNVDELRNEFQKWLDSLKNE